MHPVVILWSHPRSMSTAFERIMRERGDFTCFHESFMYDYYVHRRVREMPHFDLDPKQPLSYRAIRDNILGAADQGPVFAKEMAYYVVPALFDDPDFARRIRHSFLIRDPVKALLSYHKLDPGLTLEEVGLEAQWRLARWTEDHLAQPAIVVEAEALTRDPRGTLRAYWRRLGLSDAPHAFSWDKTDVPADWGQVAGWHGKAQQSQGIVGDTAEDTARKHAAFEEEAKQHPHLRDYLEHHLPSYQALKARALTPDEG